MENLYELALFAGGGGGLLGSKLLGWRTICYVENEGYAVEVLKARIRDGMLDDGPIWDDVRTFDGQPWAGCVDVVSAGFPCQPWSAVGKQRGEKDERNLWPDTIRVIREVRAEWCLLENVPNLLSRLYIQQIFGDLAESGYDARWDCISAAEIGAPHIRNRLWIVAHTNGCRYKNVLALSNEKQSEFGGSSKTISYATGEREGRLSIRQGRSQQAKINIDGNGEIISNTEHDSILLNQLDQRENEDVIRTDRWWATEPELGRVAHGVANRMDRLRAIGNGQVPGVVREAWMRLAGDFEHD